MQQPLDGCATISIAHPLVLSIGFIVLVAVIILLYRWHQAERKLHEYHELFREN